MIKAIKKIAINNINGNIIYRNDSIYDDSRAVFNAAIDKKPYCIVFCENDNDIKKCIYIAKNLDIPLAIRGGGHSVAGFSVCDNGIVADLSKMKNFKLNLEKSRVIAQPGLTWGEFDEFTQKYNLACPGGAVSCTGISGLTLGGGIGWLMGKYGLTCDNLLSAKIILANGETLFTSADSYPDLFWALRGGGGNFGIVTEFEYQLHSVKSVLAGSIQFPIKYAVEVMTFLREYLAQSVDELTVAPTLFTKENGEKVISIDLCYCGDIEKGINIINPLTNMKGIYKNDIKEMSYCDFQRNFDDLFKINEKGYRSYWKSSFLDNFSNEAINILIDRFIKSPSLNTVIVIEHFHGVMCKKNPTETAFSNRNSGFDFLLVGNWTDINDDKENISWVRKTYSLLKPYRNSISYVNYQPGDDSNEVSQSYSKDNLRKLLNIKIKYDPDNFFNLNQNLK